VPKPVDERVRVGEGIIMVAVDLKSLIAKLNNPCRQALEAAAGLTLSRSHYNIELEHWLLKLLDVRDSDLAACLTHYGVEPAALAADLNKVLDRLKTGNNRAPSLSPQIVQLAREAWLLASQDDFDEARALYNVTVEQMGERGMALGAAIAAQVGWRIEMLAGDLENAEQVARAGVEQLEQLGERGWMSTQACQLGESLYALGRYEESVTWALKGLEIGGSLDVYTQLTGLPVHAKVLARRGDIAEALAMARRADELAITTEALCVKGDVALALAEVLHLSGDERRAQEALGRAIGHYELKGTTAYVANARRVAASWGG